MSRAIATAALPARAMARDVHPPRARRASASSRTYPARSRVANAANASTRARRRLVAVAPTVSRAVAEGADVEIGRDDETIDDDDDDGRDGRDGRDNNIVAACVNATSVDERRPDVAPPSSAGTPLVFVTAEVSPWSKTGGLGDVCGALPAALAARGHSVVVVAPLYEPYDDVHDTGHSATFALNHRDETVRYHAARRDGVTYLFVKHPALERGGGAKIYASAPGRPYDDNDFRFALLSLAAIESLLCVPWGDLFFGGGEDAEARRRNARFDAAPVFVANDWHAALVPVFLAARYQAAAGEAVRPRHWAPEGARAAVARATTVTIVHNLFHLGIFPSHRYRMLGLPEENTEWFPALRWRWNDGGESMNFLKAGLATSQAAVLVSPSYANEVQTNELGCGMDKVLRSVGNFGSEIDLGVFNGMSGKLKGIVNGIDDEEWNPATDAHLPQNYALDGDAFEAFSYAPHDENRTVVDARRGKAACKLMLQREMGLEEDPDAPLVGFIGRLDQQKGVDVLLECVDDVVANGGQVVMLGSGDESLERWMSEKEAQHKGKVCAWVGFSVPVSHRITAASDVLVMPSRFEPCGLNQMYASRYGTIPVAHATGGLRDTVKRAMGYPFSPCDARELKRALRRAFACYREDVEKTRKIADGGVAGAVDSRWAQKRRRGMEKDWSWAVAAGKYETLFKSVSQPPPPGMNDVRAMLGAGEHEIDPHAIADAVEAAQRDDMETQWREAERRAERTRVKAARAPCRDTRTFGDQNPSWFAMLPKAILKAMF